MRDTEFPPKASVQRLMILLVPAILPISIPVGIAIGVACGLHRCAPSRRLIGTIILVTFVASAVSMMNLGWLTPTTNQLYREAIVGQYVPKGDRELTLPVLRRLVQPDVRARLRIPSRRYQALAFELHQRLAFTIAPLTFCAFALVLVIRRRAKPVAVLAAVSIAVVGYVTMRWLGSALSLDESVSPQLGAWMPQIALVLTAIVVGIPRASIRTRA
jgi:lipopolysaccharide export LptBFGC system permease protein LptF